MLGRFSDGVNVVLSFVPCTTPTAPEDDKDVPVTWAVVVVRKDDRILLLHNHLRKQWEIPGGGREAGEHPDDAARREVYEETGQIVATLQCQGLFKCCIQPNDSIEYGVLYTATIGDLLPFTVNNEGDRITLWKPGTSLDDRFSDHSQIMLNILADL